MSPSLLQPLFITSPLLRPTFSCPSTSSPITPSSPAIGVQPLMFPKLPVSSTASTDSEAHSSDWGFESCTGRSPSLLTCLFQSQSTSKSQPQSRQSSSSCSASPRTPVLPEPILRRDTVSDDSGKLFSHEAGEIGHDAPTHMNRKKSCLKFTVAPCPPHSGPSPKSSYTATIRSTPRHSSWREEEEYQPQLTVLESESDDEGYEEDEEGGFTSDEDDTGTFMTANLYRDRAFIPPVSSLSPARKATVEVASPAGPSRPVFPGRRISIAATKPCAERCTRHFSPPPPPTILSLPPAPPAAHSPSAREFCRRRESERGRPLRRYSAVSDDPSSVSILRHGPPNLSGSSSLLGGDGGDAPVPHLLPRRGSAPATTSASPVEAMSEMVGCCGEAARGLETALHRVPI